MIAFWNRRKIFAQLSRENFDKACNILEIANIKFATFSMHLGSASVHLGGSVAHHIYVHKRDAEEAQKVLEGSVENYV